MEKKRHLRRRHFPNLLVDVLGEVRPEFKKESAGCQHKLAQMVWEIGENRRKQHSAYPDYASVGHDELDGKFGRGMFAKINARVNLFDRKEAHFRTDGGQGYTAALRLLPDVDQAMRNSMRRILKAKQTIKLIDEEGRVLKTIPPAVGSKDMRGHTITGWAEGKVQKAIKINMMQLKLLTKHLEKMRDARTGDLFADISSEDIDRAILSANKMLITASTEIAPGALIHQYEQSDSGRLYAFGGSNLQNCMRLLKQVALVGLWDYDIANCHFAIFQQMAAKQRVDTPNIAAYLADKTGTRQGIAQRVDITIDQAKQSLLAVMYGASTTIRKPRIGGTTEQNSIPENIGVEAAQRLFADATFMAIAEDIKAGRTAILAAQPVTAGKGGKVIKNFRGLTISIDASPAQKLSHLIHGVEATMLDLINRQHANDIQVFQHDGFVSLRRLHVGDIEKMILDATGFSITLEENRINISADFGKPHDL